MDVYTIAALRKPYSDAVNTLELKASHEATKVTHLIDNVNKPYSGARHFVYNGPSKRIDIVTQQASDKIKKMTQYSGHSKRFAPVTQQARHTMQYTSCTMASPNELL